MARTTRSIFILDVIQLMRVEAAIVDFKTQSPAYRSRKCERLEALEREAANLRQYCKRANLGTARGQVFAA